METNNRKFLVWLSKDNNCFTFLANSTSIIILIFAIIIKVLNPNFNIFAGSILPVLFCVIASFGMSKILKKFIVNIVNEKS